MPSVISALPTAFTPDAEIDWSACERLFDAWTAFGLDGAFVCGSTGEFAALDVSERARLARVAVDVIGAERTILHVATAGLRGTCALLDDARALGVTQVAVMTPHMIGVSDATLVRWFADVAARAEGLSLYAYVFPAITGVRVSPPVMGEISRIPGVVGAKVSGEPLSVVGGYRDVVAPGFTLLTGSDGDLARAAGAGVDGVVSGVSSAFPGTFATLRDSGEAAGDEADAVTAVVGAVSGSLARIKCALDLRGLPGGASRMPVETLDAETERALAAAVARFG